MDTLLQDLRLSLRQIARSPGFALAAILTLGIGIGANATVFSVVNAAILRPPAGVTDPERLVWIYTSDFSGPPFGASSFPDYEVFRRQEHIFSGVFAFVSHRMTLGDGDAGEGISTEIVTENYFEVLGVRPAIGRFFTPDEGRVGAPAVAVISHTMFERRFGSDRSMLERPITINGRPFTVVGVSPRGFAGSVRPVAADVWITFPGGATIGQTSGIESRGNRGTLVAARLRDGVEPEGAQASMTGLARNLFDEYPDAWQDVTGAGRRITVVPEREARVPPQARPAALGFVALLMGTVGVLLLVCCSNVAGLILARAAGRGREIGIRLSLGATRRRLVRQLLTESLVVAALGSATGFLVAMWATSLVGLEILPVRVGLDLTPDARVIGFTLLAMLATTLLCGLAPALRVTRPDIVAVLKTDRGTIELGGRRITLQKVLVVGQVMLSTLLIVVCGLFVRAIAESASIDPGFRIDNMLLAGVGPRPGTTGGLPPDEVMTALQRDIAGLPGVRSSTWGSAVPLGSGTARRWVHVEGYEPQRGEDMEFHYNIVGPAYFETLEIPLTRGRGFTSDDRAGSSPVLVVNETFARRFWPGADPIGRRVSVSGAEGPWAEVVGMTRDGHYRSVSEAALPYMFLPALQHAGGTTLQIRTTGDPMEVLPAVRERLLAIAPTWTLGDTRTMEQEVKESILPQRVGGLVLGLFGSVALVLVAIGLYGTVSYAVTTRTREIGIRVALGAEPATARRLIVGQGVKLVAIGVGVALPVAWAAGRLLDSFLLAGGGSDPIAFLAGVGVMGLVALMATYVPGRRASRVDPVVALRAE